MNWKWKLITTKNEIRHGTSFYYYVLPKYLRRPILIQVPLFYAWILWKVAPKGVPLIRIKFTFAHFKFLAGKSILYGKKTVLFSWRNMTQQQLRIDFDREGKVTRRKIVSLSEHSGLFFYKFVLHFNCSTICSNAFLCLQSFWGKDSCFVS